MPLSDPDLHGIDVDAALDQMEQGMVQMATAELRKLLFGVAEGAEEDSEEGGDLRVTEDNLEEE